MPSAGPRLPLSPGRYYYITDIIIIIIIIIMIIINIKMLLSYCYVIL